MKKIILSLLILITPTLIFAADIESLITKIGGWVGSFAKLIFVAVIAAFFWGLFQFVLGEESKRDDGKSKMMWGIIAIFVMSSIWGIIAILQESTETKNTGFGQNGLNINNLLPK